MRNTLSNNTASLPTELDRNSIQYVGGGGATDAVFSSPPVPDWKGDGPGTVVGLCRAYQPIPVVDGVSRREPATAVQQAYNRMEPSLDFTNDKASAQSAFSIAYIAGLYKVVQIWPGQTVTCLHTNRPGHIWTTLYFLTLSTRSILLDDWQRNKSGVALYKFLISFFSSRKLLHRYMLVYFQLLHKAYFLRSYMFRLRIAAIFRTL